MCSLKIKDVGYCSKLSGERESGLLAESAGGGGEERIDPGKGR